MLILGRDTMKDPSLGYARTFVRQLEDCLGLALERGVKIVSNAGGLNPAGLADRLREVATGLGLDRDGRARRGRRPARRSASVRRRADRQRLPRRLRHRGGARRRRRRRRHRPGHRRLARRRAGRRALRLDADVVRRARRRRRRRARHRVRRAGDRRQLLRLPPLVEQGMDPTQPLGFPIAEIAADGSSVITKHDGTGGAVTVDTVTAQLVYEIQSTRYLNPDVTTHLDTIRLEQDGPGPGRDLRGARRGAAGAAQGLRQRARRLPQQVEFVLTGLDIEAEGRLGPRAAHARADRRRDVTLVAVSPPPRDADTEEARVGLLRCTVMDPQPDPVGRAFTGPAVELALASYPGFTMTAPPRQPTPYGVYRPEYVDRAPVHHTVVHADGSREVIADPTEFAVADHDHGPPPLAVPRAGRLARPGGCRSARSCTRAPATRAATRTSGSGCAHDGDAAGRGPGHLAGQADQPAQGPRAGARGRRARRRRLRAAQPGRGQRRHPRPARPGRRRVDAVRPAGQGARRVGALADGAHPGGPPDERDPRAGLREFVAPRGGAAPPGVGGRRRGPARAAPGRRPSRGCSASRSRRRSAAGAATCSTRSTWPRRCSRPARPAG